jgi:hypothetical protein
MPLHICSISDAVYGQSGLAIPPPSATLLWSSNVTIWRYLQRFLQRCIMKESFHVRHVSATNDRFLKAECFPSATHEHYQTDRIVSLLIHLYILLLSCVIKRFSCKSAQCNVLPIPAACSKQSINAASDQETGQAFANLKQHRRIVRLCFHARRPCACRQSVDKVHIPPIRRD